MNIIPSETPCFRCLQASPIGTGMALTCDTAGIISPAPFIIGSLQTVEAMKILIGAEEINRDLIMIDVWRGTFNHLKIVPRRDCPACQGEYQFLAAKFSLKTTSLCGQNAVQVLNTMVGELSLEKLGARLSRIAEVSYSEHMLRFKVDSNEMVVFRDGRAILRNSTDESLARGLYAKYVGA